MKMIACCVAMTLIGVPAVAQHRNGTSTKENKLGKICTLQAVTGSMMPKKVCRTQAEIDASAAESRKDAQTDRDLQNNRTFSQSKPTGN